MNIRAGWSTLVFTLAASIGLCATAAAQSTCATTHKIDQIQGNAASQLPGGAHDNTSDHDPVLIDINLCPRGAGHAACLVRNLLTQLACRASHQ